MKIIKNYLYKNDFSKLIKEILCALHPALSILCSINGAKSAIEKNRLISNFQESLSLISNDEELLNTLNDLSDSDIRVLTRYICDECKKQNFDEKGLALCHIYIEYKLRLIDQITFESLMDTICTLPWPLLSSIKEDITVNIDASSNLEVLKAHGIVYISYEDCGDLDGSSATNTYSLTDLGTKLKKAVDTVNSIS